MKIFKRTDKQQLIILRLAYGCHFVVGVILPFFVAMISYAMCHGSKPSDACGDIIVFYIVPFCLVIGGLIFALATLITLISLDIILIAISLIFSFMAFLFLGIIAVDITWHLYILVLYPISVSGFFLVFETTKNSKHWVHKYTFVPDWFGDSIRK